MAVKEFHQRLTQACENLPTVVPEYGHGRQVFISRELKVTQEAVRKWFSGESRPKVNKMRQLAALLDVDEAWLALGVEPELDRREKRIHNERTEGAVYVAFGLLTMAGGHCAFPGERDTRAGYVDFYAIIHGKQLAVHVSVARAISRGRFEFIIPREFRDVKCIGVVHHGGLRFHLVDLKTEALEEHKQRKAGAFSVTCGFADNKYQSGPDVWPRIRSLGDL